MPSGISGYKQKPPPPPHAIEQLEGFVCVLFPLFSKGFHMELDAVVLLNQIHELIENCACLWNLAGIVCSLVWIMFPYSNKSTQ